MFRCLGAVVENNGNELRATPAPCRYKDKNKQKVAMTDLPPAEQKTIQDNLAGGTVTETAKETDPCWVAPPQHRTD